ncbi:MAG: hypothetical protein JXA60_08230 [Candidatus Coatesbacteria bacterium]|nr:hypothetical protein [Candidatus Coatesbacteria bacterium]
MLNFVLKLISIIAIFMIINILRYLFSSKNNKLNNEKNPNRNEIYSIEIDKCKIEDGDYKEVKD